MQSPENIQNLLANVGIPGNIHKDAMSYALHTKKLDRQKKGNTLNAFAMASDELNNLADIVATMIMDVKTDFRFQIAISTTDNILIHWSFLEFDFKAGIPQPSLNIFICDPLGFRQTTVLASQISSQLKFGLLNSFCDLTVFIPTDTLQEAGRLCAYFTLDSISMLSNQPDFVDTYQYMNAHMDRDATARGQQLFADYKKATAMCYDVEESNKIFNFKLVCSPLPKRLARNKQNVDVLMAEAKENLEVVNHKLIPFSSSVYSSLFFVEDRNHNATLRNLRVNAKMKRWTERVNADNGIKPTEMNEVVEEHHLRGLQNMVTELLEDEKHQVEASL